MEEQFARLVVADFQAQYLAGETASPCVRCNRFVKFGLLLGMRGGWLGEG
jgi:tRNA-specific 2-thiouridylase